MWKRIWRSLEAADTVWSLFSYWGIPVSSILSLGAGAWAWTLQWGALPIALAALGTFVAFLWGFIGIRIASRMKILSKANIEFFSQLVQTGVDIFATSVQTERDFGLWTAKFENWCESLFSEVKTRISPSEEKIIKSIGLIPAIYKIDDSFNEEHNKLRNILNIYVNKLRNLIREYGG